MHQAAKSPPRVVIFADPNGAGKSIYADAILAALGLNTIVKADYIARGLSGRKTDVVAFEAGRIMLKRRDHRRGPRASSMIGFSVNRQVGRKRCPPSEKSGSWSSFPVTDGALQLSDNHYRFTRDHLFSGPSMVITVLGRSANGWIEWKTEQGQTLDGVKRQTLPLTN